MQLMQVVSKMQSIGEEIQKKDNLPDPSTLSKDELAKVINQYRSQTTKIINDTRIRDLNEKAKSIDNDIQKLIVDYCVYGFNGILPNVKILASNITYHGAFPPDEINNQLYSGFGLVWDGSSIERCDGNTGEYLKYNNPHKLSLYLVSGIPVVIWKEAAEAKFVEEYGLGITVNSLDELGEKFASLSEEEYFEMVKRVAVVSERLKNGYYLTQAIKEIEEA